MVGYLFQYSFLFLVDRNICKLGRNGTLLVGFALAIPTKAITTCKPEMIGAEKIIPIVSHLDQSLLSLEMVGYLFQYSILFLAGRNIFKLGGNGTLLVGLALAIPTKAITTCKPEKIGAENITAIVSS